jgi:hypothetical protein
MNTRFSTVHHLPQVLFFFVAIGCESLFRFMVILLSQGMGPHINDLVFSSCAVPFMGYMGP